MDSSSAPLQPSVCFTVEKIIGVSHGYGNMKTYQVQWSPSWVSSAHLVGCEKLLQEFLNQQQRTTEEISNVDSVSFWKENNAPIDNKSEKDAELNSSVDQSQMISIVCSNPTTTFYPEGGVPNSSSEEVAERVVKIEPVQDYTDTIKDNDSAQPIEPVTSQLNIEFPANENNDVAIYNSQPNYDPNMVSEMSEYVMKQELELVLLDGDTDDDLDTVEERMDLQVPVYGNQDDGPNPNTKGLDKHVPASMRSHELQQRQEQYQQHIQQQIQQLYCDICQKPFSCRSFFIRHLRQHTQEKPFQCKYCEKAFTRKFNLKKHLKSAHPDHVDTSGIRPGDIHLECQFCGETFATAGDYNEHWKSHRCNIPNSSTSLNLPINFDNSHNDNLGEFSAAPKPDVDELTQKGFKG